MPRYSNASRAQPWKKIYNPLAVSETGQLSQGVVTKEAPMDTTENIAEGSDVARFEELKSSGQDLCPYLSENK